MPPTGPKPPPLFHRRIPLTTLRDLVLPAAALKQLEDLAQRAYLAPRLAKQSPDSSEHASLQTTTLLLFGPPGTGKTAAAEALANNLELPLYQVDLSAVVSKFVGETEKNLERVFDSAEHANAILLFDEADALFGKRSDVKDAHDRYANLDTAYLLQRLEQYPGLVILTTQSRENIDPAFPRRMTATVEFPLPDLPARERLWRLALPAKHGNDTIDFHQLAQHATTGRDIHRATRRAIEHSDTTAEPITTSTLSDALKADRLERHGNRMND